MANIRGIELASEVYDLEDTSARDTATTASQTATQAGQTATQASQTATQASQTATQAGQTATQANEKATENAEAISELKSDVETLDGEVLKKSDLTSAVTEGSTAPITSGGVFRKISYFSAKVLVSGEAFTMLSYGVVNLEGFIQGRGAVKATLYAVSPGAFQLKYDTNSLAQDGITVSGSGWKPVLTFDGKLLAYGHSIS